MNNVYLYDDNFYSLISLISELIRLNIIPDNIKNSNYNQGLFDTCINLNINNNWENVEYLKNKISLNILRSIYYVYLSENNNKEIIIYNFIINYFKYGESIYFHRNIDCVNDVIKISKYVSGEAHKLKGFLRFKMMKNNFLYGEITPINNVIGILSTHFMKRLSNENWIIKDKNRKIFAIYYNKKISFLTEKEIVKLNLELDDSEQFIEDLWRNFFKTVAIKERTNLRCQMNFMPKRYWENMLEMEDKL